MNWMWKLGLKPRDSQKRNTLMGFLLQCNPKRRKTNRGRPTQPWTAVLPDWSERMNEFIHSFSHSFGQKEIVPFRPYLCVVLSRRSSCFYSTVQCNVISRVQWFWLFFTFWGITTHPWHPKGPRVWKLAKTNFHLDPWPAEIFGKNRKMRFFGMISKFLF